MSNQSINQTTKIQQELEEEKNRRLKLKADGIIHDTAIDAKRYGGNLLDMFPSMKNFLMEAFAHFEYNDGHYPVKCSANFFGDFLMIELWNKGLDDTKDKPAWETFELTGSSSKNTWGGKGIGLRASALGQSLDRALRIISQHKGEKYYHTHMAITSATDLEEGKAELASARQLLETNGFPTQWLDIDHEGVKYLVKMHFNEEEIEETMSFLSFIFSPFLRNGQLEIEINRYDSAMNKTSTEKVLPLKLKEIGTFTITDPSAVLIDSQTNISTPYETTITAFQFPEDIEERQKLEKDIAKINNAVKDITHSQTPIANGSITSYFNSIYTYDIRPFRPKPEDWIYFEASCSWQKAHLTKVKKLKMSAVVKDVLRNVFDEIFKKYPFVHPTKTIRTVVKDRLMAIIERVAKNKNLEDTMIVTGQIKPEPKKEGETPKGEEIVNPLVAGDGSGKVITPTDNPKERKSPRNLWYCEKDDIYFWKTFRTKKVGKDISDDKEETKRALRLARKWKPKDKHPDDKICPKCHKDEIIFVKRHEWLGSGVRSKLAELGFDIEDDPDATQTFRVEFPIIYIGVNMDFEQKLETADSDKADVAITAFVSPILDIWAHEKDREDEQLQIDLNRRLKLLEDDYLQSGKF